MISLKRAYEPRSDDDGFRVLIDRLWPRGLTKEKAHIDLWLKDIAPSTGLRKWFGHDPKKWEEFKKRYRHELDRNKELLNQLSVLAKQHKNVTLVFSAKDTEHNDAVVLLERL